MAALRASETDSLCAEGAMLMLCFVSNASFWMVNGLRVKNKEPRR